MPTRSGGSTLRSHPEPARRPHRRLAVHRRPACGHGTRLHGASFHEATFFHAYHAFECGLTAAILRLQPGVALSSVHADRLYDGISAIRSTDGQLASEAVVLTSMLDNRNRSLYVGLRGRGVRMPQHDPMFEASRVASLLNDVDAFLKKLKRLLQQT